MFVTGADGEIPVWNDIDAELAHRLSGDCELNTVEVPVALALPPRSPLLTHLRPRARRCPSRPAKTT